MGFSGSGSNVLKPHTHDGRVVQDGGELDFNNITQANSTAGQIFYSNGTALQQLAYPGSPAGETLTAAALSTAPSWAAGASSGKFELVSDTTLGSDGNDITVTISPAIAQADIAYLHCVASGEADSGDSLALQINSLVNTYEYTQIGTADGTSIDINTKTAHAYYKLLDATGEPFYSTFDISMNTYSDTLNIQSLSSQSSTAANTLLYTVCGSNSTASQTTISTIKFYVGNAAKNLLAGTNLKIYKVLA